MLPVPTADKERLEGSQAIALSYEGRVVAVLRNPSFYEHRKEERCSRQFGTSNPGHPYVKVHIIFFFGEGEGGGGAIEAGGVETSCFLYMRVHVCLFVCLVGYCFSKVWEGTSVNSQSITLTEMFPSVSVQTLQSRKDCACQHSLNHVILFI